MIYTLTLNPALDLQLQIEQFEFNCVTRAEYSRTDCGGKGFNVSRMLHNLKVESTALGFIGGCNGERLQTELRALGIKTNFTKISGETRSNVSIVASNSEQHIKVNAAGPTISAAELAKLLATVKQHLSAGDWWVLAGSLPRGVDNHIYANLIQLIEDAGSHVILDASGEALRYGCLAAPYLVKPNQEEAQQLLGLTAQQLQQSNELRTALLNLGAQNTVVSLGKAGALLVTKEQVTQFASPCIAEANPIGAGDAMVAGLVWRLSLGEPLMQALPYAIACGAATASCTGTELASLAQVTELMKHYQTTQFK